MTTSAPTPAGSPSLAPPSPGLTAGFKQADLMALAAAPTDRGYQAGLITSWPCLAIRPPGALIPELVCTAGPRFCLPTTEPAGSRADINLAAGTIAWMLCARPARVIP
jgi:hypothetical protein